MPSWIERVAKKLNDHSARRALSNRTAKRVRRFQPTVEILEDRLAPANITSFVVNPNAANIAAVPQLIGGSFAPVAHWSSTSAGTADYLLDGSTFFVESFGSSGNWFTNPANNIATSPSQGAHTMGVTINDSSGSTNITWSNIIIYSTYGVGASVSANPSVYGQTITFTGDANATTSGATASFAGGTEQLFIDGGLVASGHPNAAGVLTFSTANLAVGNHTFFARYYGDNTNYSVGYIFNGATYVPIFPFVDSGTVNFTVNPAPTSTALASSLNPSGPGQNVVFTATVTANSPSTFTPTGFVEFFKDTDTSGPPVATVALNSSGVATYSTNTLTLGTHTIVAEFITNPNFITSTSTTLDQDVKAATNTTISSSLDPSFSGQAVTFLAVVVSSDPTGATPTGTVTFSDGTNSQTIALSGTTASWVDSSLNASGSPYTITATYSGDTNYNGSSGTVQQNVLSTPTSLTLTDSAATAVFGQPDVFTATVASLVAGTSIPTGTVTFTDATTGATSGAVAVSGTTAAWVETMNTVANHTITAVFSPGTGSGASGATAPPVIVTVNKADTTTALAATPNPANLGAGVTLTATVTSTLPGTGTPAGNVTFYSNGIALGTGILSGTGVATITTGASGIPNLTGGTDSLTAIYTGNANYNISTSTPVTEVVNLGTTTTALTSSANPANTGATVTLTATVTGSLASTLASGIVTFMDGSTTLGTGTLVPVAGVMTATLTTNTLTAGTHPITAVYAGDTNYTGSTSSVVNEVINQSPITTTTFIASSVNPSMFGQVITFTATVSAASGSPIGTVTFTDKTTNTALGQATLASGVGTVTVSSLAVTNGDTIEADYLGSGSFQASSATLVQGVSKSATSTTLVGPTAPTVFGQPASFTATVTATAPGVGTPTGSVEFFINGVQATGGAGLPANPTLASDGTATFIDSALAPGNYSVTATYLGTGSYSGSGSSPVAQTVKKADTTTTLTTNSGTVSSGSGVVITATVAPVSPGAGTATGTVTFFDNGVAFWTGTLATGTIAITTGSGGVPALPGGTLSLTATYNGDTDFNTSTSSAVTEVVNAIATTTLISSTVNPSTFGQSVTFTATVSAVSGTPTGTVSFKDNTTGKSLGQATLASGTATVTTSSIAFTTGDTIEADFTGSGAFLNSLATMLQVVNQSGTTTTLASSGTPSVTGQPVTFTATVAAVAPGAGTPTGSVQFFINGTPVTGGLGQPANPTLASGGTATFVDSSLTPGNYSVTATYVGSTNFAGSTSAPVQQAVTAASTTVALSSSLNPASLGTSVTFTATISVNSPGALGPVMNGADTVTFLNGTTTLGTATITTTATGAKATLSTTALPLGDNPITAVFSGDSNYSTSTSTAFTETIVAGPTTTMLSSSANPSVYGQTLTFTAQVTAGSAPTPPTGTVFFLDGATQIGTGTLSGGVATFATSTLTVGTHSITARYGGTTTFASSTSTAVSEVVNQASTTTTLGTSGTPSVFGQSITLTANVLAVSPGAGAPTGSVVFSEGSTTLGSASLTGGTATLAISTLSVGTHNIIATYVGDTNFKASNSTTLTQIVNTSSTTTTVTSSLNPANFGNAVTFTATIAPVSPGAGIPTGSVQFMDGTTVLQTVTLVNGVASTTPNSALTIGTHPITAVYSGDGNFTTSTSTPFTETVQGAATKTTLASSANPSVSGQAITLTASVAFAGLGTPSGTPTGTIKFMEGSTVLGTVTLNPSAVATLTITPTGGSHAYTAVYSGDSAFATSTSSPLTQQVNQANTSTTLSSSSNPAVVGASVTFTAKVAATSPGAGTPTGTVTFMDGNTVLGTATLTNGSATFATSSLTQTSHSITAVYSGDTSFIGSTSNALTEVITTVPFIFTR
jgi:hypothetical protein